MYKYYFNNEYLLILISKSAKLRVKFNGLLLNITSPDDLMDPVNGYGTDERGKTISFQYENVEAVELNGNLYSIEQLNTDMDELVNKSKEEKPEEKPSTPPKSDKDSATPKKEEEPPADDKKKESYVGKYVVNLDASSPYHNTKGKVISEVNGLITYKTVVNDSYISIKVLKDKIKITS